MNSERQDSLSTIESALVTMRRDQQRRRLQRKGAGGGRRAHRDGSLAGAARFRMLDALAAEPGLGVTEIAQAIGVDQPRASRLVNESVDRGLIRRTPDPRDGRRSVVELSASGRAVLDAAHSNRRAAVADALAGFTPAEVETFAGLLWRFVEAWPRE